MTTVRQICTRALRRIAVVDALHDPAATDSAVALSALNELMWTWHARGVNTLMQEDWALADTFAFFVPPVDLESATIDVLAYQGTWDASANSPTLTSSDSTEGYVYKVATAGGTDLDDVTSWALNDYAVYDGSEWLKSIGSTRLHGAIVALLAMRLCDEFGMQPSPILQSAAADGWFTLQSYYVKPPHAGYDLALRRMPSRTVIVTVSDDP